MTNVSVFIPPSALNVDSLDPYSIATESFLHMSNVDHKILKKSNIIDVTLQNGYKRYSGYKQITEHVKETINIDSLLDSSRKSEIEAYTSMIDHNLGAAITYFLWKDDNNYAAIKPHFFPNFFSRLLFAPFTRQRMVYLCERSGVDSEKEASQRIIKCLKALSLVLDEQDFFFGDNVTSFDAIVYGFVSFLLNAQIPNRLAFDVIKSHQNLVDFCTRVHKHFYIDWVGHIELKEPIIPLYEAQLEEPIPKKTIFALGFAGITLAAYLYTKNKK